MLGVSTKLLCFMPRGAEQFTLGQNVQRLTREVLQHPLQIEIALTGIIEPQTGFEGDLQGPVAFVATESPVGQTGGVRQQHAGGDSGLPGLRRIEGLRQVAHHGGVQIQPTGLHLLHHQVSEERLGHRSGLEDRIRLHRNFPAPLA